LQRDLSALHVSGEISLVPAAAGVDGAWGHAGAAGLLLRCTEGEGERFPVAHVGLDAFSVPMQGVQASKAEHRMLCTALLYTPAKEHTRYLVDFELDALAEQVRSQARALGIAQVSELIAVTDGALR